MRFYPRIVFAVVVFFTLVSGIFGQKSNVFVTIPAELPVPDYGDSVKEYGSLGSVEVFFQMDDNGKVSVSEMTGPLVPCSDLDSPLPDRIRKAILDALNKVEFLPILKNGKPVRSGTVLEIRFDPSAGKPGEDPNRPKPVTRSFGTMNHRALALPDPDFPKSPNNANRIVATDVLISETGDVVTAQATLGDPLLNKAAIEAACKAKFPPFLVSGQPVRSFGQIVYR